MREQIKISATQLGELTQRWNCRRCFWLRAKLKGRLPYQSFPAVFSTIDSFTKDFFRQVQKVRTQEGWVEEFSSSAQWIPVPSPRSFQAEDPETGIILSGIPDALYRLEGGGLMIVDFKTSKVSEGELKRWEQYVTQLNAYAWIAQRVGLGQVEKLEVIYAEPHGTLGTRPVGDALTPIGFQMPFEVTSKPVEIDPGRVESALQKAREILSLEAPPKSTRNCFECSKVSELGRLSQLS
jgi:hypothetical protein